MKIIEKFSKAVTLLPEKSAQSAEEWGFNSINHLLLLLWGLPRAIFSDRDRKSVSSVWRGIFKRLKVDLPFSTAWHPQTDRASEGSNQQLEIAMRYLCTCLGNIEDWPKVILVISSIFCSSSSKGTEKPATEIMYGHGIKEPLDITSDAIVDMNLKTPNNIVVDE